MPVNPAKIVLVVDDEPLILQLAEFVLKRAGFTVVTAVDGRNALQICSEREGAFDLVLTDVKMPHLDGLTLSREINERWPGLPIVLMTGFKSSAEALARMSEKNPLRGRRVIRKPFKPQDLVRSVESALTN